MQSHVTWKEQERSAAHVEKSADSTPNSHALHRSSFFFFKPQEVPFALCHKPIRGHTVPKTWRKVVWYDNTKIDIYCQRYN